MGMPAVNVCARRSPCRQIAALIALGLAAYGCAREIPTCSDDAVDLVVRFVPAGAAAAFCDTRRAAAEPRQAAVLPAGAYRYDRVRVSAAEPGATGAPVLRAQATAELAAGASHFRLSLSVPPAPRYRLTAEVFGTPDTMDTGAPSRLILIGTATIEDVVRGTQREVPIQLGPVPTL
ncbi:MAG: hypothetical protein V1774_03205 [Candidatus Eisenbacteria bacterium]